MTTATVRETEAEAVAFIVGQSVGLEMNRFERLHPDVSGQRRAFG
jgi:hypothetical protein